jgi:hypothetical protein
LNEYTNIIELYHIPQIVKYQIMLHWSVKCAFKFCSMWRTELGPHLTVLRATCTTWNILLFAKGEVIIGGCMVNDTLAAFLQ